MKRVKIILAAISILAVVGGMLAFKVKTAGAFSYCITNVESTNCNQPLLDASFISGGGQQWRYTITSNPNLCFVGMQCVLIGTPIQ